MSNTFRPSLAAALFIVAQGVFAHDPAEHAKEAAEAKKGPDCSAMQTMDHSKIDPNDPVMKAMMVKCAQQGAGTDGHPGQAHGDAAAVIKKPKAKPDSHGGQ